MTSPAGFARSQHIRFAANRFFLSMFGSVRDDPADAGPIRAGDRVLDIGCGPPDYFVEQWRRACHFGTRAVAPGKIVGIDPKYERPSMLQAAPGDVDFQQVSFFDYAPGETFNVVYSSFCQPWLLAAKEGRDETETDAAFFSKLETLLEPGGWFAAISTCRVNNFPLYTKLVLHCLGELGRPMGYDEYMKKRQLGNEAHRDLPNITDTLASWDSSAFDTRLLLRSLEWLPLRRDGEFLDYWESGAWSLLSIMLGDVDSKELMAVSQSVLKDDACLEALKIRVHNIEGTEYILTPVHHYYHIARKRGGSGGPKSRACGVRRDRAMRFASSTCAEKIAVQLNTPDVFSKIHEHKDKVLSPVLGRMSGAPVYASVVQGGGHDHRVTELSSYGDNYADRRALVELGRELDLVTMTTALIGDDEPHRAGAFALIQETGHAVRAAKFLRCSGRDGKDNPCTDDIPGVLMALPDSALKAMRRNCVERVSGSEFQLGLKDPDILVPILGVCPESKRPKRRMDWPRLFFTMDAAEHLVEHMARPDRKSHKETEKWDWVNPLRYFAWLAYASCPDPLAGVLVPRRGPGGGGEGRRTSRSGFACWVPDKTKSICQHYLCARALAPSLSILASVELVEAAKDVGATTAFGLMSEAMGHEVSKVYSTAYGLLGPAGEATSGGLPETVLRKILSLTLQYGMLWGSSTYSIVPEKAELWTSRSAPCNEVDYRRCIVAQSFRLFLVSDVLRESLPGDFDSDAVGNLVSLWDAAESLSDRVNHSGSVGIARRSPDTQRGRRISKTVYRWMMAAWSNAWKHLIQQRTGRLDLATATDRVALVSCVTEAWLKEESDAPPLFDYCLELENPSEGLVSVTNRVEASGVDPEQEACYRGTFLAMILAGQEVLKAITGRSWQLDEVAKRTTFCADAGFWTSSLDISDPEANRAID